MHNTKIQHAFVILMLAGIIGCASTQKTRLPSYASSAKDLVGLALAAMGSEEKLRNLQSLRLHAKGHQKVLAQPDLVEGPWTTLYQEITEWRDLKKQRWRRDVNEWGFITTSIVTDSFAASRQFNRAFSPDPALRGADEWLVIGPESVLLYALDASDLRSEVESRLSNVPHDKIGFTWRGFPIAVFLHRYTHLPTSIEITRPYGYGHDFFEVWGEVTTRIIYSKWLLRPDGISYPMQMDISHHGWPASSYNLLKVELNAPMPDSLFAIPDGVKAAYRAHLKAGNRNVPSPVEIAPGIVQMTGGINATIIRQDEGLVILEAPLSLSENSSSTMVIEEAQQRFPGVPLNAVITTAYAWNCIGGARDYVAAGIPVYVLDLYQPLLQQLVAAPHRTPANSLARVGETSASSVEPLTSSRQPQAPLLRAVSAKTMIGQGRNRIELYPTRSVTDRLMVYFPEQRLLYASDLAVRNITAPLKRGAVSQFLPDLINAVKREKLEVENAFSLHMPLFPWLVLVNAMTPMAN
jgi:hypothetical protein